jgi:hypothetical protein
MATSKEIVGKIRLVADVKGATQEHAAAQEKIRKEMQKTAEEAQKAAKSSAQSGKETVDWEKRRAEWAEQEAAREKRRIADQIAARKKLDEIRAGKTWTAEQQEQSQKAQAAIDAEIASIAELRKAYVEYREAGGKMRWPTRLTPEARTELEQGMQDFDERIAKEKSFLDRFMTEMTKIGVLRGGVEWRFARAIGGAAIIPLAAVMIVEQVVKRIKKTIDETVAALGELGRQRTAITAFEALGGPTATGAGWSELAQNVREAVGYTVSNYQVLTTQNRLLRANFDDLAKAMPELATVARVMGEAFGVDAAQQLNALLDAIEKGDVQTLEATWGFRGVGEAVQQAAHELGVGTGQLDRFRRAAAILETVLPQAETVIIALGGAAKSAGEDMATWWDALATKWKTFRTGAAYQVMQVLGAGAGAERAQNVATLEQMRLEFDMATDSFNAAERAGKVAEDAAAEGLSAVREYWSRRAGFPEDLPRFKTITEEIEFLTDATQTLRLAEQGLTKAQQEAARAALDQAAAEQALAEEAVQAGDKIQGMERDWALDFATIMPLDEAVSAAQAAGDAMAFEVREAAQRSGSYYSIEVENIYRNWQGRHETAMSVMEESAVTHMVSAASRIATAIQGFYAGITSMALTITAGMSPEEAGAAYGRMKQSYDAWYNKWYGAISGAPGAGLESLDALREKAQMEEQWRLQNQMRTTIEAARSAWLIDLADYMPWEEAEKKADTFAKSLETSIQRYADKLGGLSEAAIQAGKDTVQGLFNTVFEEIKRHSVVAFGELGDDLAADAQKLALRLSPYMSLDEVLAFEKAYLERKLAWREEWFGREDTTPALDALSDIDREAEAIVDAFEEANKKVKTTTKSLKDMATAALLANLDIGSWASAFAAEHGGAGPMETYKKHAQPLVAAMIDKLWGEDFAKKTGRPPSDEEWRAHWYEQWQPLELWPGGPIAEATGPEADRAKAMLKAMGIEDFGQVFNDEYLKRQGVIDNMENEITQGDLLIAAMGKWTAYLEGLIPPTDEEDGDGEDKDGTGKPTDVVVIDPKTGQPVKSGIGGPVEFQHGGITRGAGLAFLHPNEAIIPIGGGASFGEGGPDWEGIGLNLEGSLVLLDQLISDTNLKVQNELWPALEALKSSSLSVANEYFTEWIRTASWNLKSAFEEWVIKPAGGTQMALDWGLTPAAWAASEALWATAGTPVPPSEPEENPLPPEEEGGLPAPPSEKIPWWARKPPKWAQGGGLMQDNGLVYAHQGELILPLSQLSHMVTMRMAGFGGGVNIDNLSIPVTINGGGNLQPVDVQNAVINGIRVRGGAEIMRSARRLGL